MSTNNQTDISIVCFGKQCIAKSTYRIYDIEKPAMTCGQYYNDIIDTIDTEFVLLCNSDTIAYTESCIKYAIHIMNTMPLVHYVYGDVHIDSPTPYSLFLPSYEPNLSQTYQLQNFNLPFIVRTRYAPTFNPQIKYLSLQDGLLQLFNTCFGWHIPETMFRLIWGNNINHKLLAACIQNDMKLLPTT